MASVFYVRYPASGGGSSSNASVGLNGTTAPTSSTEVGGIGPDGNLHALSTDNSGVLNVNVGSSVLPTGSATAANQVLEIAALNSIDGKTPTLGQKTMANSSPVVIASDQSAVPISAAALPLPSGAATEASLAKLTLTQGSTTSGQSGPLIQGAVTTAAPAYTTAQTRPISLDTFGNTREAVYGVASTAGESYLTSVQASVLPTKYNEASLNVLSKVSSYNIGSSVTTTGSTASAVILTASNAAYRAGDFIRFTASAASAFGYHDYAIRSVSGATLNMANDLPSAPGSGLTVKVYRYTTLTSDYATEAVKIMNADPKIAFNYVSGGTPSSTYVQLDTLPNPSQNFPLPITACRGYSSAGNPKKNIDLPEGYDTAGYAYAGDERMGISAGLVETTVGGIAAPTDGFYRFLSINPQGELRVGSDTGVAVTSPWDGSGSTPYDPGNKLPAFAAVNEAVAGSYLVSGDGNYTALSVNPVGNGLRVDVGANLSGNTDVAPPTSALLGASISYGSLATVSNGNATSLVSDDRGRLYVRQDVAAQPPSGGNGYSPGSGTVSTVTTSSPSGTAMGFILMNLDTSTANIRYRLSGTATTTSGQQLQPGRDTGFIPFNGSLSLVAESGTQNYDIQWVLQP